MDAADPDVTKRRLRGGAAEEVQLPGRPSNCPLLTGLVSGPGFSYGAKRQDNGPNPRARRRGDRKHPAAGGGRGGVCRPHLLGIGKYQVADLPLQSVKPGENHEEVVGACEGHGWWGPGRGQVGRGRRGLAGFG